jgi:sulfonate transport system permease protein
MGPKIVSDALLHGTGAVTLNRICWLVASLLVACGFVFVWKAIADAKLVSPVFLVGPERTWAALVHGLTQGDLAKQWLGTVERMFYGWLISSVVGVALGAVIGTSNRARIYLQPMLEFMRPLPASAVMPLAIAAMGLSDAMVLSVIAFGAVWPMLLATVHGFAAVEPRLYEVCKMLGLSRTAFILKVALPNSLPDILAGMRLGTTVALILTVVGEMLASRDGLGSSILLAARSFQAPDLLAGVILLGITGYVSSLFLRLLEARLLVWRADPR